MKKMLSLTLLILLVSLTGCTKEQELTIGFAGTLTGKHASVGNSELYGVQLALKEINDAGGINGMHVNLVIKDDQADPDIAVMVDDELYNDDINIVIGHALSIVAMEVMENAKDRNVLFLSPSIGTDSLTDIEDNLIRNVATTKYEGRVIAEEIVEDEAENILFLYNLDNLVLTQHHRSSFLDVMDENGYLTSEYEVYGYYTDSESHQSIMEMKIKSGEYDTVVFVGSSTDAAPLLNFINSENIDIDVHLSSWAGTGLLELIGTGDFDNIFAYFNYLEPVNDSDFEEYKKDYKDAYATEPNMVAVNAYDLVYMLKRAIEHSDSLDPSVIKQTIIDLKTFDGIAGEYEINQYGDCLREHYQMIIVDSEYVLKRD